MQEKNVETSLAPVKNKAPVFTGDKGLEFASLEELWRFAIAVVNSKIYKDIDIPEVAVVKIQAGLELGLTPVFSLSNMMIVNGRVSVWGDSLLALVQSHPDCEDVIETMEGIADELEAKCEVHRRGRVPVVRKFSVSDAKKAGLWAKAGPWQQYPKRMLSMRARSWACRDAFADALRGLSVIEEMRDSPREKEAKAVEIKPVVLPDEVTPEMVRGLKPKKKRSRKPLPAQEPEPSNAPVGSRSADVTPEQDSLKPISPINEEREFPVEAAEKEETPDPAPSGSGDTLIRQEPESSNAPGGSHLPAPTPAESAPLPFDKPSEPPLPF